MALPLLLDMKEELNSTLDNQSKAFSEGIPLIVAPQRAVDGRRCRRGARKWPPACKLASKDFQVSFDVKPFKLEEISVKVKNQEVIVEGKQEEHNEDSGLVSRQFSRRFVLPHEFEPENVSTFVNAEGKMTIKATKPLPPVVGTNEKVIPTECSPKTKGKPVDGSKVEREWEKVDKAAVENSKTAAEKKLI